MLPRSPSPARTQVISEATTPRSAGLEPGEPARRIEAVDPGAVAGVHVTVEVSEEMAERLLRLARLRGQALEFLAADLLHRGLDQETRRKQAEDALARLTPRQREVARLAVGGRTNRQIARELWLSPETVKTHLRRTLEHFNLHSKAELRLLLLDLDGEDVMRSATKRETGLPGD